MITINNRDHLAWREGLTVRDMLSAMGYTYALITVTVNGDLISKDDYEQTVIPDEAEVIVFHLAHGG